MLLLASLSVFAAHAATVVFAALHAGFHAAVNFPMAVVHAVYTVLDGVRQLIDGASIATVSEKSTASVDQSPKETTRQPVSISTATLPADGWLEHLPLRQWQPTHPQWWWQVPVHPVYQWRSARLQLALQAGPPQEPRRWQSGLLQWLQLRISQPDVSQDVERAAQPTRIKSDVSQDADRAAQPARIKSQQLLWPSMQPRCAPACRDARL